MRSAAEDQVVETATVFAREFSDVGRRLGADFGAAGAATSASSSDARLALGGAVTSVTNPVVVHNVAGVVAVPA